MGHIASSEGIFSINGGEVEERQHLAGIWRPRWSRSPKILRRYVKWIIVEAGYDRSSEGNEKRLVSVPAELFDRYAADGGDLDPDHQNRLEEQGTIIKRVPNDHDDIERFRADIIAAFEEMFRGMLPARTVDGKREQR